MPQVIYRQALFSYYSSVVWAHLFDFLTLHAFWDESLITITCYVVFASTIDIDFLYYFSQFFTPLYFVLSTIVKNVCLLTYQMFACFRCFMKIRQSARAVAPSWIILFHIFLSNIRSKVKYPIQNTLFFDYSDANVQLYIHLTAFPTKKLRRNVINPDNDMFLKVIEMHPEILQGILSTIINIVMFEDCKNQWSLSRPLLGLILLYEDYFRFVQFHSTFSTAFTCTHFTVFFQFQINERKYNSITATW